MSYDSTNQARAQGASQDRRQYSRAPQDRRAGSGPHDNPKLSAALDCTARGWRVFPVHSIHNGRCTCGDPKCANPGKHPRTPHGLNDATTVRPQILKWWNRWPSANLAVAPDVFWLLDSDPRHGGDKTLAKLEAQNSPLPETLRARSGGDGPHYLFNMPDGIEIRNLEGEDWEQPGLDIRGMGGYFLVEPSNHLSGGTYRWENPGTPIADAPDWLIRLYLDYKASKGGQRAETLPPDVSPFNIPPGDAGAFWLKKALQSAVDGYRNKRGFWLACQLRDAGLSQGEAELILLQYAGRVPQGSTPYTDKEALSSVKSAYSQASRPPARSQEPRPTRAASSAYNEQRQGEQQEAQGTAPSNSQQGGQHNKQRHVVIVNDRDLHEAANEALQYLVADNLKRPRLFVRGGLLCRVRRNEQGQPIIEPLTLAMLKHALSLCTSFGREHYIKESMVTTLIAPPDNIVKDILERGEWEGIPPLLGLSTTPPISVEGEICTQEGYDLGTQLYYAPTRLKMPAIPESPSAAEVAEARAVIEDVIGEFPFVDQSAKANLYAALLTPLLRAAIDGPTPMGLVDAPQAGTGKGLQVDVHSLIVIGENARLQAPPTDADEWRKMLTSAFLDGDPLIVFDNLDHELSSGVLSHALTAMVWIDRILGFNRRAAIPVRCSWLATGNNIRLAGDMPRRCYWIRLNAKVDKPWLRAEKKPFRHMHLRRYVRARRGLLVAALLTLARAWFAAGQPEPAQKVILGTYEEWSRILGGILAHAKIEGFLGNLNKMYEQADRTSFQWEAFLIALHDAYPDAAFSCKTIVHDIEANTPKGQALREALPERLTDALQKPSGRSFSTTLGIALNERVERRYGLANWRLVFWSKDSRGGTQMYRVVMGDGDDPEPEPEQPDEKDRHNAKADGERVADLADLADLKHPERAFFNPEIYPEMKNGIGVAERSARSARSADQMQSAFKVGPAIVNQAEPAFDGTAARQSAPLSGFDALSESKKHLAVQLLQAHMQPAATPTSDELSVCLTELLAWARRRNYRRATLTGLLFGEDGTEQSWQSDLMSVLIPGSKGILLKARGMVAETRQIDAAEEAESPPWWATESDSCAFCAAPGEGYSPEGKWCCTAHLAAVVSTPAPAEDDDQGATVPRLPTPPKLTIVQAEQAPAEAAPQDSPESDLLPWRPEWDDLFIRDQVYAMAQALGWPAWEPTRITAGDWRVWYAFKENGQKMQVAEAHAALLLNFAR